MLPRYHSTMSLLAFLLLVFCEQVAALSMVQPSFQSVYTWQNGSGAGQNASVDITVQWKYDT